MTDPAMAEFTRRAFGKPPESVPEPESTRPGNHVPREGSNPKGDAHDLSTFTAALFDRAHGE